MKRHTKKLDNKSNDKLREANDAKADIDANGIPVYILRFAPIIDWTCYLSLLFFHFFSCLVCAYQVHFGLFFTWKRTGVLILLAYWKIVLTFGVLHRFFSHKVFARSRPVAFVLGLLASTSGQRGPLWWGSKHIRHHKFCANEGDPHISLSGFRSWIYKFVGWTVMLPEMKVDWEYVHAEFKQPEMVLLEFLSAFIPFGETLLWYYLSGIENAMMEYYATIISVYIVLAFNVINHNDKPPEKKRLDNGRYKCISDKESWCLKYIPDFMGEMDHKDHHRYPRQALHPTHLGVDLLYWVLIWPFEKSGVFYNVCHDGRGESRRRKEGKEHNKEEIVNLVTS
jgi:stearoyl-CoA desaturase (delta-9 desaturase)